ncbi:hypothetical protein QWY14_13695 [Planococcus sp. N028]|uniref:Uncharacterized protein n=1 Tax=Planococcus shixiaomingii TaxID=3058393 RepID=A0ABT8N4P2_9BACL|nr:hypothetical protein [Planococcus sp. N028]MDN7242862.1 hypothetical protein [Planococcus sp. N028]
MSTILNPKDITGTTRFIFDFDLTNSMLIQLMKEFVVLGEQKELLGSTAGAKLIDYENKRVIEINKDFISFTPILSLEEKESVRKRIYKHVAKKSEVYTKNSFENLDLAKRSLLTEELRSCASLLYYSYHKFFNGRLYRFLNDIGIEDHQIVIDEMEHYTSALFYKFNQSWNSEVININSENYQEIFCTSKKFAANPLILKKYFFKQNNEDLLKYLEPYIVFLLKVIANKDITSENVKAELEEEIKKFLKKPKKDRSQKMEVRAAISQCVVNSFENIEEKLLWYIYIVSLRLYWLRQTADYDFDFEVNTSVREMSLLVNIVNNLLGFILEEEISKDKERVDNNLPKPINFLNPKTDATVDESADEEGNIGSLEIFRKDNFTIERKFPEEVDFNDKVNIYTMKIHLDSFFDKEKIINTLNFTPFISNKGKFFIYVLERKFNISLYIHVNNDGRWTFWSSKEKIDNLRESDLIECINIFMADFNKTYIKLYSEEFCADFLSAKPIVISEKKVTTSALALTHLFEDFFKRRSYILNKLIESLSNILVYENLNNSLFLNEEIEISFEIATTFSWYGIHTTSSLPEILYDNTKNDMNKKKIYLDFFLIEGDGYDKEYLEEEAAIFHSIKLKYEESFKGNKNFIGSQAIGISTNELDQILSGNPMKELELKERIGRALNDIAFSLIEDENYDVYTLKIIEEALRLMEEKSFPMATKGKWFLRNPTIPVEEAKKYGKEFYEKALLLEKNQEGNFLKDMYQKYQLELCEFYMSREINKEMAVECYKKALGVGEDGMFYEEVLFVKEKYFTEVEVMDIEVFKIDDIDFYDRMDEQLKIEY